MAKSNNQNSKAKGSRIDLLISKLALIIAVAAVVLGIYIAAMLNISMNIAGENEIRNIEFRAKNFYQLSWCYDNDVKPCHVGDPEFWGEGKPYAEKMQQIEN